MIQKPFDEPASTARITVFAPDMPFPDNRGGRADVWRRILALRQLNIAVQLVCFYVDVDGKRPTEEHRSHVLKHVDSLITYPIKQGFSLTLRRLAKVVSLPWHVVCRILSEQDADELTTEVLAFMPDLLWCEGVWVGSTAKLIRAAVTKPLVYRSHNIEHLYMPRQAAAARRPRDRLAWAVACIGLARFERAMIRDANWVFDISSDDMAFWQEKGIRHISWLPPVAAAALASPQPALECRHDVLFLGNLTTPNNVRGVQWLLEEIWPLVRAARPGTELVVAGSNPGPFVQALCRAPGVTLMPNVADASAQYASARVLVNPVRTGSGTHIKAIEMLMTGASIVTATQGTMGLPPEVKRLFTVADTAPAFADAIVHALDSPEDLSKQRAVARQTFGIEGLADAISDLRSRLALGTADRLGGSSRLNHAGA